jgi:hypothetical protein
LTSGREQDTQDGAHDREFRELRGMGLEVVVRPGDNCRNAEVPRGPHSSAAQELVVRGM